MTDDEPKPPLGPPVLGTLPADDLRCAFVAGAAWWEFQIRGATMWQDDRRVAEEAAEMHYPGGKAKTPMWEEPK